MAEEGMQSPLARKLRMLRAREGITLAEVEERSGVTRESIGELERGKRIPFGSTLQKLARAYGVTIAELLEEEPALPLGSARTQEPGEPVAPESLPAYQQWLREQENRRVWQPLE